jgi:hypothetical protein
LTCFACYAAAAAVAQIVSPLGIGAVALAASSQLTPQRLLVDEYTHTGSNYVLAQPATELAAYLHKRWVSARCYVHVSAMAGRVVYGSKPLCEQPGTMAGWAQVPLVVALVLYVAAQLFASVAEA